MANAEESQKFLTHVDQTWKLEALTGALRQQGIEPRIRQKAREYVSILTGMGNASYDVFVNESDFLRAMQVIHDLSPGEPLTAPRINDFRRVIALSLLGLILAPVVFNGIATWQSAKLWPDPDVARAKKILAAVVLLVGWFVALSEVVMIARSWSA